MNFHDLLNEKWETSIKMLDGTTIEFFKNPTRKELSDSIKQDPNKAVRIGVTDKPNPDVYVWSAEVLHMDATGYAGLKFDVGFLYESKKPNQIITHKDKDKIKNFKPIITKLKSMFPKANTLIRTSIFNPKSVMNTIDITGD